jgi:hypothetical protein
MTQDSERDIERTMQHMCACQISLNNEGFTTVERDEHTPVSWAEIKVLQEVHGEEAIYDIRPVSLAPRDLPNREKERLVLIYGRDIVEKVYAGKSFLMEWFVPGWPLDPAKISKKKIPERTRPPKFRRSEDAEAGDVRI